MIYVLTHFTSDWSDISDIVVPVLEKYCDKHGYILDVAKVNPYQRYTGEHKLKQIKSALKNNGDVALVIDGDAIITNYLEKIEDFLDSQHDLYFSEGLNCGIFIIRKSYYSDFFINWCLMEIESQRCNCEQDAVEKYMNVNPNEDKIKVLPHPCFNSYMSELYPEIPQPVSEEQGQWIKGKSFILHLPGIGNEKRIEILTNIKEQIVYG